MSICKTPNLGHSRHENEALQTIATDLLKIASKMLICFRVISSANGAQDLSPAAGCDHRGHW